jgi:hypothetical protein
VPDATTAEDLPPEVTDERIYEDLKAYDEAGLIDYVLPTVPLGEQWIIGWDGKILKFTTKEGIVGFLVGIQVCAVFAARRRQPSTLERFLAGDHAAGRDGQ